MNFRNARCFFALSLMFFGAFSIVNGQGIIVPLPCDFRPCAPLPPRPIALPNVLPVKSIALDVKIDGQIATTRVTQIFRNDSTATLEGTYFFPIPETASVVEFAIWENGVKLVGEVRSKADARRIYDAIVRRRRDPGLLEYAGKNLLQASIFPISPNSDKKIELVYTQVLTAENATVAYRYPLGTGRNLRHAPTSENSNTRRLPSAAVGTISGTIEIVGKQPARNIYSPSHQIEITGKDEKKSKVTFETTDGDRDFQLFYGLSNNDFGLSLLTYREAGKDGYFLLQLSPKDDSADKNRIAKDIVFVLDTSGSMADEGKLDKARAALLFGIRALRDGDRFNVINFAGEEHLMENNLIAANASGKQRGVDFVNQLTANGGTNINAALLAAAKQFTVSPRPQMIVFMTDGLPTVGENSVEKIIANVGKAIAENVRLFTFGVGYDVNTTLLDKLAAENSGAADYVEPKEDLEIKVSNFFTKISAPALSAVQLDFAAVETDFLYPRRLTDLFKGTQLTVIGRYRNARDLKNITVRLTGKSAAENRVFAYPDLEFPLRSEANDFLPRLWATRRVGWILEQIRANGETKELRDEITELGTRYAIVTPYTSYLATDGSFESEQTGAIRNLPLNNRQINSLPVNGRAMPRMKQESGSDAVQLSVQQNAQQSNISLAPASGNVLLANTSNNQFVGAKNFTNLSGVWQDAEFKPAAKLPEVKLQFGSDKFFALLEKEPALARFFALGEQVVVVWNGTVYRVGD